ncbi:MULTISPECIES: MarR family winged helix-turn-helix transcriptional regulator [Clostridium]|uniref:MarR family winged helix-turn-helix transcriptional regulator n=1 Tax=Clostridium TaxID=1485 RepID=UPI0008264DD0|nr:MULTISPECIES: MarR family winged helix-turn-helix transcriptional regulator [Clostridium]PJI07457.1 MarR family transcriptional regulator [Clostridium sp. CT7]
MEDQQISELLNDIFSVTPVFAKAIIKIFDDIVIDDNLSKAHIKVLFVLDKYKKITITDLGKVLYAHKPNVTCWVDRLVKSDLAKRIYDKNDRRIIYISLTDNGNEIIKNYEKCLKDLFSRKLYKLNDDDLKLLMQTLNNMKMLLNKLNTF